MLQRLTPNRYLQFGEEMEAMRDAMMRENEPVTLTAAPLTNSSPDSVKPSSIHILSPTTLRTRDHKERMALFDPVRCYGPIRLHDSTVLKMIEAMPDGGRRYTDQERADEIIAAIVRLVEKDFKPDPPMHRPRRRRKK